MSLGSSISLFFRQLKHSDIIFRIKLSGLRLFAMTSDTFSDQNANRTFQSVSHAHWCPKHEFLGVEIILQSFIAQMSENAGEQLKDYDTKNTLKNVISSKNSE